MQQGSFFFIKGGSVGSPRCLTFEGGWGVCEETVLLWQWYLKTRLRC